MVTVVYTAARVVLIVFGWLTALGLSLGADYMLPGAKWPVFIGIGCWWTLTCILYVRQEAERSNLRPSRHAIWHR